MRIEQTVPSTKITGDKVMSGKINLRANWTAQALRLAPAAHNDAVNLVQFHCQSDQAGLHTEQDYL
jgi:hypothetical protein